MVYTFGGMNSEVTYSSSIEALDASKVVENDQSAAWRLIELPITGRHYALITSMFAFGSDKLLIFGGVGQHGRLSDGHLVDLYDNRTIQCIFPPEQAGTEKSSNSNHEQLTKFKSDGNQCFSVIEGRKLVALVTDDRS